MDHALPFQCSASVVELKDPAPTEPTAQQSEAVTQLTWPRLLSWDGSTLGEGTVVQPLPAAPAGAAINRTTLRTRPADTAIGAHRRRRSSPTDSVCGTASLLAGLSTPVSLTNQSRT